MEESFARVETKYLLAPAQAAAVLRAVLPREWAALPARAVLLRVWAVLPAQAVPRAVLLPRAWAALHRAHPAAPANSAARTATLRCRA